MIRGFGDDRTEDLFHGRPTRRARTIADTLARAAIRKLDALNAAHDLLDLRAPPGNRLEAMRGDLAGFHSIRVNDQWRIVFRWLDGGAEGVSLIDYH